MVPGQLLIAFKHLPLGRIHKDAQGAAQAAYCAGIAGMFWSMHDGLFRQPRNLDDQALVKLATAIGLEPGKFRACLTGGLAREISADLAEAKEFGISGTPAFLIGTVSEERTIEVMRRLSGNQPFLQFKTAIDESLASTNRSK